MPMYMVSSVHSISASQKEKVANVIVDTHCGITDAPRTFVNVVFSEGVPLKNGWKHEVLGAVRKGRTGEMNAKLQQTLTENIVEALNESATSVGLSLLEVPATWVMEGGHVLPEPGEEDQCEWLNPSHA